MQIDTDMSYSYDSWWLRRCLGWRVNDLARRGESILLIGGILVR